MSIDWDDLQGNILRGYFFNRARFLFVAIDDDEAGLQWLRSRVVPRVVPPPLGWRQPPRVGVNVSFSHEGLRRLGTDPAVLRAFPPEFREGMWARARALGDTAWERDWCDQPIEGRDHREAVAVRAPAEAGAAPAPAHVLVAVHADEQDWVDEVDAAVRPADGDRGVSMAGHADLAVLDRVPTGDGDGDPAIRREHFGFADGLSQPRIAGVNEPAGPAPRPWYTRLWTGGRAGANPVVQPGEFVLGYPDEDNPEPVLPEPAGVFRNGSFQVVRKLAQDVPAFWAFVGAAVVEAHRAGHTDVTVADVAARIMGRDRDGRPLVGPPAGGNPMRDFSFRHDPEGRMCPLGSHVRRSNPRDGSALGAADVNRHRLLRRGLPYGPRSAAADPQRLGLDLAGASGAAAGNGHDDRERGIFFVCFGASISRQFEFVQRSWLNDGDALGIGHCGDVVSGAEGTDATVTVAEGRRVRRPAPVVRACGGEYFFMPGIRALRSLAMGDLRPRDSRVPAAVPR